MNAFKNRKIYKTIETWAKSSTLKPLILKGARQVGKTQLMLELGKKCFANYCYCNFDVDGEDDIKPIFEKTNNPSEIIKLLENQKQIRITNKTLLIFDEIHRAPKVMSALKYFAELSDGYKIICSTSLLSEILHYKNSEISFPVGKIEELEIHPLDFEEFLLWTNPFLYESYVNINLTRVIEINLHNQLKNKYKDYLIVGGMPECVLEWINVQSYFSVRNKQNQLLRDYENDLLKPSNHIKIASLKRIFDSIDKQLAKDNHKFMMSLLGSHARLRDYDAEIKWLINSKMIILVNGLKQPFLPLRANEIANNFKLYFLDVGMLGAKMNINPNLILDESSNYIYKGALTENYVFQQIKNNTTNQPYFYSWSGSSHEIDCIIEFNNGAVPIEIKSTTNVKSNSLNQYLKQYKPKIAIRLSLLNYSLNQNLYEIPLYLICKIFTNLNKQW